MKPNVVQDADGRWAKSSENSPGGAEGDPLREIPRKLSGWSSRVHPKRGHQGGVRSAARVAVALGLVWILLAFWAYPARAWWRTIPGVGNSQDEAQALIRDAAGDMIVAGKISDNFAVTKFSGITGEELWRQEIDGTGTGISNWYFWLPDKDEAQAVAVDGSGDVIAAGSIYNSVTGYDFTVIKFSGATGEELWRQEIDGSYTNSLNPYCDRDAASAVAVDASGDVIAAGYLHNYKLCDHPIDLAVIKFSGATGEELWRQEIHGAGTGYYQHPGDAQAVAVDASGDAIAVGYLTNSGTVTNSGTDRDFTVIKFSGAWGDFGGTHRGRSLLVKDNASGPESRQLKVVSKDPHWPVPPQGSANDPTLAGASVRLVNPSSGEEATFDLPPGPQWRVTSTASGVVKYVYRDPTGINGPCIALKAFSGKRVQVICKGSRGLVPFTLNEPRQRALVVSVQFGAAEPQCTWFGGRVMKDQGTSSPGPTGIFKAKNAESRLEACPSPSGAFLDVTTGVVD